MIWLKMMTTAGLINGLWDVDKMTGSLTIVAFFVAAVALSVMLDIIAWEVRMRWWISAFLYTAMIFLLLWGMMFRLGVL